MRREFRAAARLLRPVSTSLHRIGGRDGLTVIGWHRVDHTGRGLSTAVTDFEAHLDVLEEWGAHVLPLEEAAARLSVGTLPPRAVSLTFDDGYASAVETAWPLLRKRDMPASLFVCPDYLSGERTFAWDAAAPTVGARIFAKIPDEYRLATAEQLTAAHRDGLHLGSHTMTHPWLPGLDDDALDHELRASRELLSDLVGETVLTMAYPTGGWDRRVRAAAGRAGYRIGITVTRGTNHRSAHPLSLRRAFVPGDPDDLRLILDGAYTYLRPLDTWRGREGAGRMTIDILEPAALGDPALPSRSTARLPQPRSVPLWLTTIGWIVVAAVVGFAVGTAAELTCVMLVAAVLLGVLLGRVELAAIVLIAASVFEGYLSSVSASTIKGLALVVIGAWAIRRTRGRLHQSTRRSPVLMCALALVVVILVSTIVNLGGPGTAGDLGRWAGFLATLVVLVDCLRSTMSVELVARVYVAACAAAAVCGLVAYTVAHHVRVSGPIGDPNDFAFFLLAALPLSMSVRHHGRRTLPWDLASIVIGLAILGTFSRGAIVGLAVMLVFAVVTRQLSVNALIGLVGLVLAFGGVVASVFPDQIKLSFTEKSAVAGQNVDERLYLWHTAEQMTLSDPLFGQGPGSFAADHDKYSDRMPLNIDHVLDVAHNTYLGISAELGILGLAAFLAVLATGFYGAWRAWRTEQTPVAAGVLSAMVGTVVAASFISEQYYLPFWLLAALGAGLAARAPDRRRRG